MNDTDSLPGKIDYEAFTRRAMRGVIRDALAQVSATGLPGGHHFYICFDTSADGVVLADSLRDSYPRQMTIVLQHRFDGLQVGDNSFSVILSFQGKPQRLTIPYAAILDFTDPAASFRLQFPLKGRAKQNEDHASENLEKAVAEETDAEDPENESEARILQFPRKPDRKNTPKSDG